MSVKKPLVITNGQIEQLQPGDRIDLGNAVSKKNINVGAMIVGQPVFVSGADCDLAQANDGAKVRVVGLVMDATVAPLDQASIMATGILTATQAEWDAVGGIVSGLVTGTDYYLDPTNPGMLVDTPPTAPGKYVVHVGVALSSTQMKISIEQPVKL